MKTKVILSAMIILTLIFAGEAFSFDGNRKGFILGGGFGFGVTSYTQTLEFLGSDTTSDRENAGAFATDFKIGYAPNEQLEIYYASKVSWFSMTNALDNDVTIAFGVGALGITHNLRPTFPTYFVTGGLGLSSWSLPFEDNAPDPWSGVGFYIGAGYEFSKHYSVEFDIFYGNPGDSEGGLDVKSNATAFKISINALAY